MKTIKRFTAIATAVVLAVSISACTSGGGGSLEDQLADKLQEINSTWELYEIVDNGDSVLVKVEVSDNVSLDDSKTAAKALQELDPEFKGYIEFYNSEVGMTLRKIEVYPGSI